MTCPPEGGRRSARPPHCTQPPRAASRPPRPRAGRAHDESCPAPGSEDVCELTGEVREWARRTVAALPPLTSRQRDILVMLLRSHR